MLHLPRSQARCNSAMHSCLLLTLHRAMVSKSGFEFVYSRPCNMTIESIFFVISRRNSTHKKCPICQEKLNSTDDSWVLSEIPRADEVNEKILSELSGLTKDSSDDEWELLLEPAFDHFNYGRGGHQTSIICIHDSIIFEAITVS